MRSSILLRAKLLAIMTTHIVTFNGVPITAQSTTSSTAFATSSELAATTTSTASGTVHTVAVAKDGNAYTPNQVYAEVGDIISFQFYPTNHTVIRAQYEYPCIPYEDTGENLTGFFSGFFPLSVALEDPPTWNLTINSTEPIFYYCSAPNSCIGAGMVGVINPNSTQTFEVQQELAFNSTYMLLPGEAFPEEGGFSSTMTMNYATATSALASITASATSTPTASSSSTHHGLSTGAIAGIAVAGAVVLAIIVALTYLLGRNKGILKSLRNEPKYGGSSSPMTPAPDAHNPRSPHYSNPPMSATYQYSPELQQQQAQSQAHGTPGFYDPRGMYGSQSPPPAHAAPPYHQHTSWGGNEDFVRSYPGAGTGTPPTSPPLGSPPMNHPGQGGNLSSLGRQDARMVPQSPQELAGSEKAPVDATEVPTTRG